MAYITNNSSLEIARGKISRLSSVNKFGSNTTSPQDTWQEVWDGSTAYSFPTTAVITSMSQTANQAALTGETIEIQGLDENWNQVTQTADLDASDTTTVVTLTTPLIRVFRAKVLADVVTTSPVRIHNAGETTDYAIISTGENQTLMAIYTVPANCKAYITQYYCGYVRDAVKDPDGIQFRLRFADRANGYEFQTKHELGVPKQTTRTPHHFNPYYVATEKTDIIIDAYSDNATAHTHAGFDIILEQI